MSVNPIDWVMPETFKKVASQLVFPASTSDANK